MHTCFMTHTGQILALLPLRKEQEMTDYDDPRAIEARKAWAVEARIAAEDAAREAAEDSIPLDDPVDDPAPPWYLDLAGGSK